MDGVDHRLETADAEQLIASIDTQVGAGQQVVRVSEHGCVHATYAWAIARSIRLALDTAGTFDTPEQDDGGEWWAIIRIPLGRFPA